MQSSLRTSSCRRRSHVRTGLVQPVRCRLTRTSARRERQRHAILRMQDSAGESTLTMPRLLALPALSTVTTNALPVAFRLLPRRHSRCRPAPLPAPPVDLSMELGWLMGWLPSIGGMKRLMLLAAVMVSAIGAVPLDSGVRRTHEQELRCMVEPLATTVPVVLSNLFFIACHCSWPGNSRHKSCDPAQPVK